MVDTEQITTLATGVGSSIPYVASIPIIKRFIEAVEKGIGAVAAPWQMKRLAQAEQDIKLIQARGESSLRALQLKGNQELEELKASLSPKAHAASICTPDNEEEIPVTIGEILETDVVPARPLATRSEARLRYQEAKRQLNIERVVNIAFSELPPEGQDEAVDDDWIARFFEWVKDISNEDMQKIWGKLLAGEVARPRRFSLRTLDILRNLSTDEANLFKSVTGCIESNAKVILFGHSTTSMAQGLDRLCEARILHAHGMWSLDAGRRYRMLYGNRELYLRLKGPGMMDHYALTSTGIELLQLIPFVERPDYVDALINDLKRAGYEVSDK
ncbi:DUF2806 domain-containing protein [Sorangium sp. So ce1036]|uniref:DUF2806 domain-containing protein n=1 Tax=Sorangium sp. So ce1036 TaxID=3133328 RepID=UPI003F055B8C